MSTVKARMSSSSHWTKVVLLYSILCPTQLQPLEKKEAVFPPSPFQCPYQFLQMLVLLLCPNCQEASLKVGDRFLGPSPWDSHLGCVGQGPGTCLHCRDRWLEHKWLLDLSAQGLRDSLNPAFKFRLCHRLDEPFQVHFNIFFFFKCT